LQPTAPQHWETLDKLLTRLEKKGINSLSVQESMQVCQLYRQVSIDLSRARSDKAHPQVLRLLNQLVGRAHAQVYRTPSMSLRSSFGFLLTGFPKLVRKHALPILLTMAVFYGTAIASALAVMHNPLLAYALFDEDMVEYENLRLEKQQGEYKGNFTFEVEKSSVVGAQIIVNNIRVSMIAFATGALLGLPCLVILIFNGRMLGTLEGMMINAGYFVDFNALVLTHGVLELTAICISGAAGLLLAWALIAPGLLPRRQALKAVAMDAVGLLLGCIAMLVVAGIIEAYVTPHFSQAVRFTVAGTSGVLLLSYVLLAGRQSTTTPDS
jgi:uncharacterized membrane protein SpoIIM required for sporulation